MSRSLLLLASLLFASPTFAAGPITSADMKYAYEIGEALYASYQGDWFGAIARRDAAQLARAGGLDATGLGALSGGSSRLGGDFELNYRMDRRAGRAMEALIESSVRDDQRNEAIFLLARMYFRKDQPGNALQAIERVRGDVPKAIRTDLAFLRANILLANGRNSEAATILHDLQGTKELEGFSAYNLGIALLRVGDEQAGREYLDRAGRIQSDDQVLLAIKDKANLVLGEVLMGENNFEVAKEVLDRVRLNGPLSNRALLSSGWADASRDLFEKALVPWSILAERDVADAAVQEAKLAVPYAYSRLGVYGTAALNYEAALKVFGSEIDKLDASIASIRRGSFLKALVREELRQDGDWIGGLRSLPETPETFYLLRLMASHDFQESFKNYLDLEDLRRRLERWSADLVTYEDIIRRRRAHYEPLLPTIDRELKALETEWRSHAARRDRIARQLEALRREERPELLVTSEERSLLEQLDRLERLVTPSTEKVASPFFERLRRLRGVLYWNMHAEYEKRLADTQDRLRELDQDLEQLRQQVDVVALARRTAIESYAGHDDVILRERQRITEAGKNVQALIERQGQMLEIMAVNELTRQRDRLEEFRVKARFALADSYDRAGKAQGRIKNAP